jgi:hypothetical protein
MMRYDRRRFPRDPFDRLEERTLLNGAFHRAPAAEVRSLAPSPLNHVKFKGSDNVNGNAFDSAGNPAEQFNIQATGRIKRMGTFQLAGSFDVLDEGTSGKTANISPIDDGTATLTDSQGDQLRVSFGGTATYFLKKMSDTMSWSGTITGGTGAYQDATGTFMGTARFTVHTPKFQAQVTVGVQG